MTLRRSRAAIAALLLSFVLTAVAAAARPGLGAADLLAHVTALTAPEMEGRGSGTPGGDRAARYIADALARAGLRPGGEGGTFFQEFPVATIPSLGPGNRLEVAAGSRSRWRARPRRARRGRRGSSSSSRPGGRERGRSS